MRPVSEGTVPTTRAERQVIAKRKYDATAKGRARYLRYRNSAKGMLRTVRYNATQRGGA
jgi:hypothetical protein